MAMENTTEWNTKLGKYWQTVFNMGLFPVLIIGAILLVTGIAFSLSENLAVYHGSRRHQCNLEHLHPCEF